MIGKLFKLLLLAAILAGAWYYGRQFIDRKDIQVTLVFDAATGLAEGSHVLEDALVIGKVKEVAKMKSQEFVSVHVPAKYRDRFHTDSVISVEGKSPGVRVIVDNTIAVGPAVDDNAILHARKDRLKKWLVRAGEKAGPLIEDLGEKAAPLIADMGERVEEWTRNFDSDRFDDQLDQWAAKVPEWKRQGKDVFERNLDEINQKVDAAERLLRRANRDREAAELRRRFSAWTEKWSREAVPPETSMSKGKSSP